MNICFVECIILHYYIQVNVQFAAPIEMTALHETVEGRQRLQSQESITVLDLILRYSASLK